MIRTGDEYRESIRDGREVFINGEKVKDAAGLSDSVMGEQTMATHDSEASRWFAAHAPMLPYSLTAA